MLMKHMTLFSLKQLTVYQDSSETRNYIVIVSFDSESNQIGYQGKKYKQEALVSIFLYCFRLCHLTYLFIAQ
jgi:hypothetical protein